MEAFAIYREKKVGMAEMLLCAEDEDHLVFESEEEGTLEAESDAKPAAEPNAGPAAEPAAEASSAHYRWVRPVFRFGK